MASDPTPTPSAEQPTPAAPVLLDPAVKRSWMRASRVTVLLTVVFCLLLTGLRWLDAQRQARAVGAAVVNLVDAAQGVTSVTLPAVDTGQASHLLGGYWQPGMRFLVRARSRDMLAFKLASAQQSTHRGFMPNQPHATIGLTGRCRGRSHVASLRARQAGAPELGR